MNDNSKIIGNAMAQAGQVQTPAKKQVLELLSSAAYVDAFKKVMGDKTPMFIQTIRNVLLDPKNAMLAQCEPNSILRSCMACAVTGLTIDPAFGQAAIVPFRSQSGMQATFMPMKNGLVQLANNTGIIKRINASPVYEGDIKSYNPFTGDYEYNQEPHKRDILVGYIAYLQFLNGADHYLYMTVEEIQKHGQRYSKNYKNSNSLWHTNFTAMAEKTVIKQILNKWGSFDTLANSKLWLALKFDSSTPSELDIDSAVPQYPDVVEEAEVTEVEPTIVQ